MAMYPNESSGGQRDELVMWLHELVKYYREKVSDLTSEQHNYLAYKLDAPLQINVLWSAGDQPESSYSLLIFTHFQNKPDSTFNILGPFEPYRFSEQAAKMFQAPEWNQELPQQENELWALKGERRTYRDQMVFSMQNYRRNNELYFTRRALLTKDVPNNTFASTSSLGYPAQGFIWEIWGNIEKFKHDELINRDISDAKATLNRILSNENSQGTPTPNQDKELRNYGAVLFPQVWVGEMPTQPTEDKILGKPVQANVILNAEFGGSKVLLRQDGLIGIDLAGDVVDSLRKSKVLEKLNELVAAFSLQGVPLDALREHDLIEISVNHKSKTLDIRSWNPEHLKKPIDNSTLMGWVNPDYSFFGSKRIMVDGSTVASSLNLAVELSQDATKQYFSSLVLQSSTQLRNSEYSQSFLTSWLILEAYVGLLWNVHIKSKKPSKSRERKLMNPSSWTTDHMIETLNLAGEVDQKEYDTLMSWKGKRNRLVHSGVNVSEEDASQCLDWATKVARRVCGLTDYVT